MKTRTFPKSLLGLAVTFLWSLSTACAFVLKPPSLLDGRLKLSKSRIAVSSSDEDTPDMGNLGFVLLAGGTGSRMKASMPKQYLAHIEA